LSIPQPSIRLYIGLFLLSAATLAFEITLTRIFSVAQFYHFAFLIVSIALLGYGASGSLLSLLPNLKKLQRNPLQSLAGMALATGLSILFAYLLINWIPFDSFSVFVDRKQIAILFLHYTAMAMPFFFSGMAVGLLLSTFPRSAGRVYAANLIGSASGCIIALIVPSYVGGVGTLILCSGMTTLAAAACLTTTASARSGMEMHSTSTIKRFSVIAGTVGLLSLIIFLGLAINANPSIFELNLSPYKALSYALQYPGAEIVSRNWNSFSRVDVVRSEGIRSLPGISIRYMNQSPPEDGLFIDGDELNPLITSSDNLDFAQYLPSAVAFILRPNADTLILEPRGGLEILSALTHGSERVTSVEVNPLIINAAAHIYDNPLVEVVIESDRSYIRRSVENFDIVILPLANSYHPVRSGAYSLAEDYQNTVEAFQDAIRQLNHDGILLVTRWLQNPPSESLRAFALAITALENDGIEPDANIVAFRGYNTATLLIKKEPFTQDELEIIREFTTSRAFDLVYASDLTADQVNQYAILPEPIYWNTFNNLLNAAPRSSFYNSYQYDVSPPTDDNPFFGHYFKWSQIRQVIAELGKYWQPFGGAGYLVVFALLILSTILAAIFIFLPVFISNLRRNLVSRKQKYRRKSLALFLIYFSMLGFGYLFVEIPLIQKFILYLGQPAYAVTTVLFSILLFSGIGSQFNQRFPVKITLILLVAAVLSTLLFLPMLFESTMGFSMLLRFGIAVIAIAPLGFLMGIPFPSGIQRLSQRDEDELVPWVWAVNGSSSVISAVLAALLALSYGFNMVLVIGACCYAVAWLITTHPAWKGAPALHP